MYLHCLLFLDIEMELVVVDIPPQESKPLSTIVYCVVSAITVDYGICSHHVDGSTQDCSNSIANTLELLQSCAKPSIFT